MTEPTRDRKRKQGGPAHARDPSLGADKIIDLSVPLNSLDSPVYPGSPPPVRSTFMTIQETGFQSNIWMFEEHTGTHVDAPAHILPAGPSIDGVPLSRYVGNGIVLDLSRHPPRGSIEKRDVARALEGSDLAGGPQADSVLLFYTGYTRRFGTPAWMDNPVLSSGACDYIARLGVKAIGFDAASPDREPFPAHKMLLPKGIAIYENLVNLECLIHKRFIFVGAPLSLVGGTASPVRAFAILLEP